MAAEAARPTSLEPSYPTIAELLESINFTALVFRELAENFKPTPPPQAQPVEDDIEKLRTNLKTNLETTERELQQTIKHLINPLANHDKALDYLSLITALTTYQKLLSLLAQFIHLPSPTALAAFKQTFFQTKPNTDTPPTLLARILGYRAQLLQKCREPLQQLLEFLPDHIRTEEMEVAKVAKAQAPITFSPEDSMTTRSLPEQIAALQNEINLLIALTNTWIRPYRSYQNKAMCPVEAVPKDTMTETLTELVTTGASQSQVTSRDDYLSEEQAAKLHKMAILLIALCSQAQEQTAPKKTVKFATPPKSPTPLATHITASTLEALSILNQGQKVLTTEYQHLLQNTVKMLQIMLVVIKTIPLAAATGQPTDGLPLVTPRTVKRRASLPAIIVTHQKPPTLAEEPAVGDEVAKSAAATTTPPPPPGRSHRPTGGRRGSVATPGSCYTAAGQSPVPKLNLTKVIEQLELDASDTAAP